MAYTIHAFDLVTNTKLGIVDAGRIRWREQLNGQRQLEFRIDLAYTQSREQADLFVTSGIGVRPVKFILYDNAVSPPLVRSFMLLEARYTARRFLEFRCQGLWWWYEHFPMANRQPYVQREQTLIAASLVYIADQYADNIRSGQAGRLIDAYSWQNDAGVLRDRTYEADYISYGQRVNELAAVIDGFDFDVVCTFDGERSVRETFTTYYPRVGTTWPDSGIQIDADTSAPRVEPTWLLPATDLREIGAGEGDGLLTATAPETEADRNTALADYPALWRVAPARKSISTTSVLQGHADRDLVLANRAAERWETTILDQYDTLKTLTVGDEAQLKITADLVTPDYLYPDGVEIVRRVVGRDVYVSDDGGPDRVTLTIEDSDLGGS